MKSRAQVRHGKPSGVRRGSQQECQQLPRRRRSGPAPSRVALQRRYGDEVWHGERGVW